MKRTSIPLLTPVIAVMIAALSVMVVFAQGSVNPGATITWPPPVYVLRGEFTVRGTANLPNMTNYFLEYQALGDDLDPLDTPPVPITLPQSGVVVDGVLGTWDTTAAEDGLYALQLTVNVRGGQPVIQMVGPLRIENAVPPFASTVVPTLAPTLAPAVTGPTATVAVASANVRTGDSTLYPPIAALFQGDTVPIIALSTTGSTWYQIQLPDGRRGWISGSTIQIEGSLSGLPRIAPPPVPVTPTPIPPTAIPTQADLVAGVIVLDPGSPTCAQTFTVGFDVANLGTGQSLASGVVSLIDTRAADGTVQATTIGGFPILIPGQTFRVNMPLTVSTYYNEVHTLTLIIDPAGSVPDINRSNNTRALQYTLQKGGCP
jgi:hypothetical protein